MERASSAAAVLSDLVRHPVQHFVLKWNWKSALLSSICRATMFLVVNLPAGVDAGLRAMTTEVLFRVVASGALGSATQAFRDAAPTATTVITALVAIPAVGHLAEYSVHRLAGTARLGESIATSVAFSMLTTAFNLFAMRRGVLVVGHDRQSLVQDLRRLPALIGAFVTAIGVGAVRPLTRRRKHEATCQLRRST